MKCVLGDLSGIPRSVVDWFVIRIMPPKRKTGRPPRSERRVKLWVRQSVYHSWNERKNQLVYGSRTHSEFAKILLHRVTISPGPASQFIKQVSNSFTVNVIFCRSKANTWRLKNISCNRNEPKQHTNTWQIMEVSN